MEVLCRLQLLSHAPAADRLALELNCAPLEISMMAGLRPHLRSAAAPGVGGQGDDAELQPEAFFRTWGELPARTELTGGG